MGTGVSRTFMSSHLKLLVYSPFKQKVFNMLNTFYMWPWKKNLIKKFKL